MQVSDVVQAVLSRKLIPRATYRLQLGRHATFSQSQALIPYLHDLGISHCYLSPILKAQPGSRHGYDICDHSRLNPEIGTRKQLDDLYNTCASREMGILLDVVPNHMGIAKGNDWWDDVLENGSSSSYASYFDIDWHPSKPELENKVLLPILEDQYGKVLEEGKIRLIYEDGGFFLSYRQTRLPVAPRTTRWILSYPVKDFTQKMGGQNEPLQEYHSILTALAYLPPRTADSPAKLAERHREKVVIKRRVAALYGNCENFRWAVDLTLEAYNGKAGSPESFDSLHQLIESQPYRLAFWRVATEEINYRRFSDMNELAAIRIELDEVFQSTHQLILELLAQGKVDGIRIDHPDGLWDPPGYFRRLQQSYLWQCTRKRFEDAAESHPIPEESSLSQALTDYLEARNWKPSEQGPRPLYIVAEKILQDKERLPRDWLVEGTTGYDFLASVNGIFVDQDHRKEMDRIYTQFVGTQTSFANWVNSNKKMIMLVSLSGEVNAISHQLKELSEKNRRYRDFTLNSLIFAIREVIACLPVYRTYINGLAPPSSRDKAYIEQAVQEARRRNPRTARAVFDFLRETLLLSNLSDFREQDHRQLVHFVMKFQQITGPVMAKAVEDTTFYVYNRLVSLNEVGSDPSQYGESLESFHSKNLERQARWPHSLLATSSHDTKRGEDVRARINVLSEICGEWRIALNRWSRLNAYHKVRVEGEAAPDRNDEYLFYQTLLGAWPLGAMSPEEFSGFRERMASYMQQAIREAKVHSSWINPNQPYDFAVRNFVDDVLSESRSRQFLKDFRALQRRLGYFGRFNSLSQSLLKLTCPGVPDLYQGCELWDLSLVNPDNRRPVDFKSRQALLENLRVRIDKAGPDLIALVKNLLESWEDGQIKLFVLYRTLNFRRKYKELFSQGSYLPLETSGPRESHVCAFARRLGSQTALVTVPRLVAKLTEGKERIPLGRDIWENTRLSLPTGSPRDRYLNLFTGEKLSVLAHQGKPVLPLSTIFHSFPLALLHKL